MIKGGQHGHAIFRNQTIHFLLGLVLRGAGNAYFGTLGADAFDLVFRDQFGHADHGANPGIARRIGKSAAIIAGRYADNALFLLFGRQFQNGIRRPAQLEAAGILLVFAFQPHGRSDLLRQAGRRTQWCMDHVARDGLAGRKHITKCDGFFHGDLVTICVGRGQTGFRTL